jgi:hypothetical protein
MRNLWGVLAFFVLFSVTSIRSRAASPSVRRVNVGSSLNFFVRNSSGSMSTTLMLAVGPGLSTPFGLQVKTAEPGRPNRISQAAIWINDAKVIQPSDFANGESNFTTTVNLNTDNIVRVEVSGPINSYLWAFFKGSPDRENAMMFNEGFREGAQSVMTKIFSSHPYLMAPYELIAVPPWTGGPEYFSPSETSATIILNGRQILSPLDFQRNTASLIRREVDLMPENTLQVRDLKGLSRGGALAVLIQGKRAPGFPGPSRLLRRRL